eukprot:TRINITY_DN14289_c0_g1_i1.p1 TRINITY_DN14289_c0_g1~~TRINITY_DN14289_c0_g1_i1.p1  ORF type:complete len:283 (+),score=19.05 TRINITY_DN14289_c0_g1_i1:63-911(+)
MSSLLDSTSLLNREGPIVEPISRAKLRLERRKLCWLRHVAYSRSTLLACGKVALSRRDDDTPYLSADSTGVRIRPLSISVGCQTSPTCVEQVKQLVVDPVSLAVGERHAETMPRTCPPSIPEQAPAPSSSAVPDNPRPSCLNSPNRAEPLQNAFDEHWEPLPIDSVVIVFQPKGHARPSEVVYSLGVVREHHAHRERYTVSLFPSALTFKFSADDIELLGEATLQGLVSADALNGEDVEVGLYSSTKNRVRVKLRNGRPLFVTLEKLAFDVECYETYWNMSA